MTVQAPSVQEFEAAAGAWGNNGSLTTPTGLKLSATSSALQVLDGFSAATFKDASGNIIVSFEGAYQNAAGLTGLVYDVTSTLADNAILAGNKTASLSDAAAYVASVIKANPKSAVYVTGAGALGGVEAEAAASANAAKLAGGATFGAAGLPGNTNTAATTITDYVDFGDPVANVATDFTSPYVFTALAPAKMYHYGNVVNVGNSAETGDLALLATDATNFNGSNGFNGATSSTVPAALEIFTANTELFHGLGNYDNAVAAYLNQTPQQATTAYDLGATSTDLAAGLKTVYAVGTAANAGSAAAARTNLAAGIGGRVGEALDLGGGVVVNTNTTTGEVTLNQPGTVNGNTTGGVDVVTDLSTGTAAAVAGVGVGAGAAADTGNGTYSVTASGVTVYAYGDAAQAQTPFVAAPGADTVTLVAATPATINISVTDSESVPLTGDPTNITVTNPNLATSGPISVTIDLSNLSPVQVAADTLTLDGYSLTANAGSAAGDLELTGFSPPTDAISNYVLVGTPLTLQYTPPNGDTNNVGDGTLTIVDTATAADGLAGNTVTIIGFNTEEFGIDLQALDESNSSPNVATSSAVHKLAQAMAGLAPSGGAISAASSAAASAHLVTLAVAGGHGA